MNMSTDYKVDSVGIDASYRLAVSWEFGKYSTELKLSWYHGKHMVCTLLKLSQDGQCFDKAK